MGNVKTSVIISVIRSLLDEYSSHCGVSAGVFLKEYADLLEAIDKAEPVAWMDEMGSPHSMLTYPGKGAKLYAHPPTTPTGTSYTQSNGRILKDGHTMFLDDIVKHLNRLSFVESELTALKLGQATNKACSAIVPDELLEAIDKAEPVKYQCREIGESDWRDCTKEQYEYAKTVPELDYRTVTQSPIDERAEFEKALKSIYKYADLGMKEGEYIDSYIRDLFALWQAARKLSAINYLPKQEQSPIDERAEFEDWWQKHWLKSWLINTHPAWRNSHTENNMPENLGEAYKPYAYAAWQARAELSVPVVPDCLSNPKAGDTYAPNECSNNDNWVAGIDVDKHGHAIECFGLTKEIAEQRRDFVLAMLKGEK